MMGPCNRFGNLSAVVFLICCCHQLIAYVGGALVGFVLVWKGSLVTLDYFSRGVTVIGILDTPQFILTGIIPVGGFLLLLEFVLQIWRFASTAFGKEGA